MIRLIINLVVLLNVTVLLAQNGYDAKHSSSFGDFLLNTGQYAIAAQEYERALFLSPGDTSVHLKLFKSYCYQDLGYRALESYYALTNDTSLVHLSDGFADVYLKHLIRSGRYADALKLCGEGCCVNNKERSMLAVYLLQTEWDKAHEIAMAYKDIYSDQQFTQLLDLSLKGDNLRYKKKGLSALMSAIIPGSGKVYSGYWQDGLISFVMTSISGFMAFRSYDKYGINNGYTWVSGIMAVGYYGGNIYGGYRSARRYNNRLNQQLIDETKGVYKLDY